MKTTSLCSSMNSSTSSSKSSKSSRAALLLLLLTASSSYSYGFAPAMTSVRNSPRKNLLATTVSGPALLHHQPATAILGRQASPLYFTNGDDHDEEQSNTSTATATTTTPEQVLDGLLENGKFRQAVTHIQNLHKRMDMTNDRWERIFSAIEQHTADAEENQLMMTTESTQYPLQSPARMDMTNMYETLQQQDYLKLYGAVNTKQPPAAGTHTLTPNLLEEITKLSMKSLTPKPTNNLLLAGFGLAIVEGLLAMQFNVDFNLLVFVTILLGFLDRLVVNGAVFESLVRILTPGLSQRIAKHEAGHFLCAYLLGCPVEGYVLSSWAALQDKRFDKRQVSAGTSFFDAILSKEYAQSKLSRSSVDRYSIIVMAGIAAEALEYGRADGGAGDEMALIYFLSQLNGNVKAGQNRQWNDTTIRNQARWGALQAVLMMRHYKPCYDALVDVMERGGTLGDCIYAIEKAARDNNLGPLKEPLGYILEYGPYGTWTTEQPPEIQQQEAAATTPTPTIQPPRKQQLSEEESLEALKEYRQQMEERLREIDEKLGKL